MTFSSRLPPDGQQPELGLPRLTNLAEIAQSVNEDGGPDHLAISSHGHKEVALAFESTPLEQFVCRAW